MGTEMEEQEAQVEAVETPVDTGVEDVAGAGDTILPGTQDGTGAARGTPVADSAQPASTTFPDHAAFRWDEWDKTPATLPEQVQPWAQRVYDSRQEWLDQELEKNSKEMGDLRSIYDEILSGNADPRVETMSAELEEIRGKYATLETESNKFRQEYEEYQAAINEQVRIQGEAIANQFRAAYPEIFEDTEKQTLFRLLLAEDWDLESIPKVMALGDEGRALARKARSEGTPDGYALQLAGSLRSKPAKPRPAARLTSGSDGSSPSGHFTGPGKGDAQTIDEQRDLAAAKALRLHEGGRK
jgi:hypothetical protein